MNSFEEYLKNNKERMDDEQINPEIWLSIENSVLKKKNKSMLLTLRRLLAVAAVLFIGLLAYQFLWPKQKSAEALLASYGIQNEVFTSQLELKTKVISQAMIPVSKKADFDLLLGQLKFLDQQYEKYLEDAQNGGYNKGLGLQIIDFYKTKIELLDKIQQEIETIDYYEKKYNKESSKFTLEI